MPSDAITSLSFALLFFLVTMTTAYRINSPHVALCPHDDRIEALFDFCSDVITSTYDVISGMSDESLKDRQKIVNMTCETYKETTYCYKRLLAHCQPNQRVSSDVHMIIDRLSIYYKTCLHQSDVSGRLQLIRCYFRLTKPIKACSQAFDSFYHSYALDAQSRSACRVLNSAIRCFLEIEQEIMDTCDNPSWSDDFHRAYIRPLVQRSHNSSYHIQCLVPPHLQALHFSTATQIGPTTFMKQFLIASLSFVVNMLTRRSTVIFSIS